MRSFASATTLAWSAVLIQQVTSQFNRTITPSSSSIAYANTTNAGLGADGTSTALATAAVAHNAAVSVLEAVDVALTVSNVVVETVYVVNRDTQGNLLPTTQTIYETKYALPTNPATPNAAYYLQDSPYAAAPVQVAQISPSQRETSGDTPAGEGSAGGSSGYFSTYTDETAPTRRILPFFGSFDGDKTDLQHIIPSTVHSLDYMEDSGSAVDNSLYVAQIAFQLKYPAIALEKTGYAGVLCHADQIDVAFTNIEAYNLALQWPNSNFLLITNHIASRCNTADERGVYLVTSSQPNGLLGILFEVKLVAFDDVTHQLDISYGSFELTPENADGSGAAGALPTDVDDTGIPPIPTSLFDVVTNADGSIELVQPTDAPEALQSPDDFTEDPAEEAALMAELDSDGLTPTAALIDSTLSALRANNSVNNVGPADMITFEDSSAGINRPLSLEPGTKKRHSVSMPNTRHMSKRHVHELQRRGLFSFVKKAAQVVKKVAQTVVKVAQIVAQVVRVPVTTRRSLTIPFRIIPLVNYESQWGDGTKIWEYERNKSPEEKAKEKTAAAKPNRGTHGGFEKEGKTGIILSCINCGIQGTLKLAGTLTVIVPAFDVTNLTLEVNFNAVAGLQLGLEFGGSFEAHKSRVLKTIPLAGLYIPKLFSLGPALVLEAGANFEANARLGVTAGGYLTWNNAIASVNLAQGNRAYAANWQPSIRLIKPSLDFDAKVELMPFIRVSNQFLFKVFDGKIEKACGVAAQAGIGFAAEFRESSDEEKLALAIQQGADDDDEGVCIGLELKVYVQVLVFFFVGDINSQYELWKKEYNLGEPKCFGHTAEFQRTPTQSATPISIVTQSPARSSTTMATTNRATASPTASSSVSQSSTSASSTVTTSRSQSSTSSTTTTSSPSSASSASSLSSSMTSSGSGKSTTPSSTSTSSNLSLQSSSSPATTSSTTTSLVMSPSDTSSAATTITTSNTSGMSVVTSSTTSSACAYDACYSYVSNNPQVCATSASTTTTTTVTTTVISTLVTQNAALSTTEATASVSQTVTVTTATTTTNTVTQTSNQVGLTTTMPYTINGNGMKRQAPAACTGTQLASACSCITYAPSTATVTVTQTVTSNTLATQNFAVVVTQTITNTRSVTQTATTTETDQATTVQTVRSTQTVSNPGTGFHLVQSDGSGKAPGGVTQNGGTLREYSTAYFGYGVDQGDSEVGRLIMADYSLGVVIISVAQNGALIEAQTQNYSGARDLMCYYPKTYGESLRCYIDSLGKSTAGTEFSNCNGQYYWAEPGLANCYTFSLIVSR